MYPVVIIDDNKIAVEAIEKSTDWEKYNCYVAGKAYDGVAGMELIEHTLPAIVIIDIQMPGLNGLEVIQRLKEKKKETQFIIISGYSQFEYAQRAIRCGVKDYLLKPIMTEEMETALSHVVEVLEQESFGQQKEMDSLEQELYEIRSGKENYSSMVQKAIGYVERNLGYNITLQDICEELLVSTGHFSKCFKRETGVGFASYVTMVKMEKARVLLKNPKNRVNEVAYMLGYNDYAYFFQVFKKQFGYAPSEIKTSGDKKGGNKK